MAYLGSPANKAHHRAYIRKCHAKIKRLLKQFRRGSRKAEEALIGEMVVVKTALEGEIQILHDIDPTVRAHIEQNAEQMAAALDNYLDETANPRFVLGRKILCIIAGALIMLGVVFLFLALFERAPVVGPAIQAMIQWWGFPRENLVSYGVAAATVGAALMAWGTRNR